MERSLPDDVIASVLRRLPPTTLAASRCVCKAWRAIVDDRRLLCPHSFRGIFVNYSHYYPDFFFRPSTGPAIHGDFINYVPADFCSEINDHCNGLLLLDEGFGSLFVVNPATRQWARLPPSLPLPRSFNFFVCLVFEPTVSPHYEVFLIPHLPVQVRKDTFFKYHMVESPSGECKGEDEHEYMYNSLEWPPSPCKLLVFSSSTGRWEERSFVRKGEAAGITADMVRASWWQTGYAVYWQDTLYAYCRGNFIMRISLSTGYYQVMKTPLDFELRHYYLGKSENGVYYASILDQRQLMVWILNESCGQTEWVLKHQTDLQPLALRVGWHVNNCQQIDGPWILFDIRNCEDDEDDKNEASMEQKFEWNSDTDNVVGTGDGCGGECDDCFQIIGFHPYKEFIFMHYSFTRGVAYHLNSSKVQDLGNFIPKYYDFDVPRIISSYPYTPCWMGELPKNGLE